MRVEYDHYSKMCKSNKIPPIAQKDIPSYTEQLDTRIKEKTNPSVRIQNNIKPNATFCFVRFALNFFDVMIKTHD